MAKGYPDYFGQSIWPKFGTLLSDVNHAHIIDGANTDIIDINVQGQVTDLLMLAQVVGDELSFETSLTVDTLASLGSRSRDLVDRTLGEMTGHLWVCNYIKSDLTIMQMALQHPIPFHDRFLVNIANGSGVNLTITWFLGYYVIT